MPRQHWLTEIADEVRARAQAMVADIGAALVDTVPFGHPVQQPKPPGLDMFLQLPPELRHAYLANLGPDFTPTVDALQAEAVSRFGAMAQKLAPMWQMEGNFALMNQLQEGVETGNEGTAGVQAATQELADLLGIDPFAS